MKKIGLVSVHNPNYGSLLQTYALHTYLKENGYDNEIILYSKKQNWKQFIRIFNFPLLVMKMQVVYRDFYCKNFQKEINSELQKRTEKFTQFKKDHFKFSYNHIGWKELKKCNNEYDTFMIGSDQVWNPINIGTDFFNLLFVNKDKYKIAYAPSFGVSTIPKSQRKKTINYLNRIDALSTREITGKEIIKELTDREAEVVCDPTLLIDKKYWDALKGKSSFTNGNYIFCYFLGNNPSHREFANQLKTKTGCKIVALQHLDEFVKSDLLFGDEKPFNVGPAEFVNLIANANYVLTDSFHCSIFSMLYEKKFFVFSRFENSTKASTNSRIVSLLTKAGIPNRYIKATDNIEDCLSMDIDYAKVHNSLSEYIHSSELYMQNALAKVK